MDSPETGGPMALYELHALCSDPGHAIWGRLAEPLLALHLISERGDGGHAVHGSVRNIVLSAMRGDGVDLTLGDPLAEEMRTP